MADADPSPSSPHSIWTIKGFPNAERSAATKAAQKAGVLVGQWMAAAVREKIKADRAAPKALAPIAQPSALAADRAALDLDIEAVERAAAVAASMAEASKRPPSRRVQALVNRRLTDILTGKSSGQTRQTAGHPAGQTMEADPADRSEAA